jgi:hypothetical protein
MYPNDDAPRYLAGFVGTLAVLAICISSYLTLPFWLMREARIRKAKTGHAMPLQAMEDAENSQVSVAAQARLHEINQREENEAFKREELKLEAAVTPQHVEIAEK